MMTTRRLMTCVTGLILPGLAVADPVDESELTTFLAGEPACAAEVNQTIQALVRAVNDNAMRVAELEARLRHTERPLEDVVSGSTYAIYSFETALGEDTHSTPETDPETPVVSFTHGRLAHWSFAETGTMVLHDGGTLTYHFDGQEREVYVDTLASHDVHSPDVPNIEMVEFDTAIDDAETGSEPGAWSLDGQTLTLTIDGDSFDMIVSADGDTMMHGLKGTDTAGSVTLLASGMVMAMRTNPADIMVETFDGGPLPHDGPDVVYNETAGSVETRTFRIRNLGDEDLEGLGLTIDWTPTSTASGHGYFEITTDLASTTLAPGAHALVTIGFLSDPYNDLNGTLTISSSDADTPSYIINLDGPKITP